MYLSIAWALPLGWSSIMLHALVYTWSFTTNYLLYLILAYVWAIPHTGKDLTISMHMVGMDSMILVLHPKMATEPTLQCCIGNKMEWL